MLVLLGGTSTWWLHTGLCKFVQNISTNIWSLGKHTWLVDLKLGKVSSLFISYNITISRIYAVNGFQNANEEYHNSRPLHVCLLFSWFNLGFLRILSSSAMCMLSWKASTCIMFISTIIQSCIIRISRTFWVFFSFLMNFNNNYWSGLVVSVDFCFLFCWVQGHYVNYQTASNKAFQPRWIRYL